MKIRGLYKYANSSFYWYRWTENGKRKAVSLQTDDLAEAFTKVKQIQAGAWYSRWERAEPTRTSARKLVEDYVKVAQARAKKPLRRETAKVRSYILHKFLVDQEIEDIGQIRRGNIEDWLSCRKRAGLSRDTLHTQARALKTFLAYLVNRKLVRADILSDFEIPEPGAVGRKNWLKKDVVKRVIGESHDDELTFILHCGFHAGLRRNEISNTRVGWFDLEAGIVHVQNEVETGFVLKDRENRSIPLAKEFKDFLQTFLADKQPGSYAIRPEKTQGVWRYRYDFDALFASHMRRCGVKCTIHDMRRSFASNLVSAGESIYIVAKWLGDGIPVVERSYGHLAPSAGNINRLT
ncbi:MAG TPA: site-specific integrase [Chthoniobacterales bacterium]|jgi:integrase|nr:site-specific integrase [Chthoniobacterales bacterium]